VPQARRIRSLAVAWRWWRAVRRQDTIYPCKMAKGDHFKAAGMKLGRLHHWKLGWFGAVEHTADIDSHLAVHLDAIGRVGSKAAGPDELGPLVNRR
jgi:hypothetical protein